MRRLAVVARGRREERPSCGIASGVACGKRVDSALTWSCADLRCQALSRLTIHHSCGGMRRGGERRMAGPQTVNPQREAGGSIARHDASRMQSGSVRAGAGLGPLRRGAMAQTRRPWVACPPSALLDSTTDHTGPTLPTGLPCGSPVCATTMRLFPPRCTTFTADSHPARTSTAMMDGELKVALTAARGASDRRATAALPADDLEVDQASQH
jgi:hypothetical protein